MESEFHSHIIFGNSEQLSFFYNYHICFYLQPEMQHNPWFIVDIR